MEEVSDQTEATKSKRKLILAGVFLLVPGLALLGFFLRELPQSSQRLADGSVLTVVEAKFGATNSFLIGDTKQRFLARFIPSNGLSIAGFKLQPPVKEAFWQSEGETLALMFRISGANPRKSLFVDQGYNPPKPRVVL